VIPDVDGRGGNGSLLENAVYFVTMKDALVSCR
jgi:hypothetical protein